jgi:DNA primase
MYMARRKLEDENVRSLNKTSGGNSYGLTLPLRAIRSFKWQARQKLQITVDEKRKRLIIEDWKG